MSNSNPLFVSRNLYIFLTALIADAAAMFVDVVCYLFAIGGEAINPEKARTKRIYALIVSFLSLAVLFALSVYFLKESIDGLVNKARARRSKSKIAASAPKSKKLGTRRHYEPQHRHQ